MRLLPLLLLVIAACKPSESSVCQDLCIELVTNCQYAAYPSLDSCIQGCTYNASEGADVDGEAQCITDAQCDTFAIVECEHQFGIDEATATP